MNAASLRRLHRSSFIVRRSSQSGFTLAAVLTIMSVMLIFIAYTVPRAWSLIRQRDRDLQTIYVMQQYAKAIDAYQKKNNTYPVSMDQLVKARQPRFLRCPKDGCVDPLTGQMDWFVIPQSQARPPGGGVVAPGAPPPPTVPNPPGTTAGAPGTAQQPMGPVGVPLKDYAGGPFVGVRPNKTGPSIVLFNGADHYEQWSYTVLDYQQDRTARQQSAQKIWQ